MTNFDMTQIDMTTQVTSANGFIAALDQSGGSTPKALRLYGVPDDAYANDTEMYDHIHTMRTRIADAPAFTGAKVIGAILFEDTMNRMMHGKPTAAYLWQDRRVVPFLKIDKGLEETVDGCQLMKPMGDLDALLTRAVGHGIFGTKMRSVISAAHRDAIAANISQQFDIARQVLGHGLVPIIEPEVTISIADKVETEALLLEALLAQLDALSPAQNVMLKVTLPEVPNIYQALVNHPRVLRVVALSGGYDRAEATARLGQNTGIIASFSRALTEGLSAQQSDDAFNAMLSTTIEEIFAASVAG